MARRIFWDTSGLRSLMSVRDSMHAKARSLLGGRLDRHYTTNLVIAETCTLLLARNEHHLIPGLLTRLRSSAAMSIHHFSEQSISIVERYLLKHLDQGYSYVDCSSFVFMSECRLEEAATSDHHFSKAGFTALLN